MILLGLTGSIGMGKSTTAEIFAEEGIPVWDADAAVHRLYAKGGAGVEAIASMAPEAVRHGAVDRSVLRELIIEDRSLLPRIERAIHPLVAADRQDFLDRAEADGADLVLLDIPLLFETGADDWLDRTAVVSAPEAEQRRRVLARPGMTRESLDAILTRQMPDAEKRLKADFVIDTGRGIEHARTQVREIIGRLRAEAGKETRDA